MQVVTTCSFLLLWQGVAVVAVVAVAEVVEVAEDAGDAGDAVVDRFNFGSLLQREVR